VVLLNGVIGHGVDEESDINRAIREIAHVLRPKGALLIGWNSLKNHQDPLELEAVNTCFHREQVLQLPLRQTFDDTDHVYDWFVKPCAAEASTIDSR
jgi:SAM-dependent methyltransferase